MKLAPVIVTVVPPASSPLPGAILATLSGSFGAVESEPHAVSRTAAIGTTQSDESFRMSLRRITADVTIEYFIRSPIIELEAYSESERRAAEQFSRGSDSLKRRD